MQKVKEELKLRNITTTEASRAINSAKALKIIEITHNRRFGHTIVKHPLELEPRRILLYTTLYHKRRNMWDLFHQLGGNINIQLKKPSKL